VHAAADIAPSPTTRVEIGTARSVQTGARERCSRSVAANFSDAVRARVFTFPRQLAPLTLQNKKVVYDLLFRTSAETLLEVARDPKHLGAEIGFFSVLALLESETRPSPTCACVVPAGDFLPIARVGSTHPMRSFFLSRCSAESFAGKFVAALQHAFQDGSLSFHGDLQP